MRKAVFLFLFCVLQSSCDRESALAGLSGTNSDSVTQATETLAVAEGNYFYFSYDDSASTVAPELVKYKLLHGQKPDASLGRPWEFLNLESARFRTGSLVPVPDDAVFSLSMGLRKNGEEYHFGAMVKTPEITREARKNLVLTLIVDISGSMGEATIMVDGTSRTKMELVKFALTAMTDSLKAGDVVNLVPFSTDASTALQGAVCPAEGAPPDYLSCVAALHPTDSTDLNLGIQEGYRTAWATFDAKKSNRAVILTDAYANTGVVDSTVIAQGISRDNGEGIYFSGIGVGADFNEAFLNELTEKGKGSYFSIVTHGDAERAMKRRFIALIAAAARDVRFRLDFPASLRHVTTASEESSTNPEDVQPTNFSHNTTQYFFEGFESAAAGVEPADTDAFTLTVAYKDPETLLAVTRTVRKTVAELLSAAENGPEGANIRDARAVFLLAELIGGRITGDALGTILSDDYADAAAKTELFLEYSALIGRYRELAP